MNTKHKDYEIRFDEKTETWKCDALALSDASLSKLKFAIEREGKKRRTVNVEVLYLEQGYRRYGRYSYEIKDATVLLIRDNDTKATIRVQGKRDKEQVNIRELFPVEQREILETYVAAKNRADLAEKEADAAQEEVTPLSAEAIRELVTRKVEES